MLETLVIILLVLWLLGAVNISGLTLPDLTLFSLNGRAISLVDLFILIIISWIVGLLPTPFREIVGVVLAFWILSMLGILAIAGLSNILVIALVIGLVVYLFGGRYYHHV